MSSKFTFNDHSNLRGKHALFAPSQSSWLRYDNDKIAEKVLNQYRTTLGTEIHDFAASQIDLKHKYTSLRDLTRAVESYIYCKYMYLSDDLVVGDYAKKIISHLNNIPKEVFEAVRFYINDGVGFRMNTEQCLYYSDHIFGHADTICFRNNFLRIHDLKTGSNPAHMEQLEVYAALFCLEYKTKPSDIQIELRLYQWDGVEIENPDSEVLTPIIDKIITNEKIAADVEKEI